MAILGEMYIAYLSRQSLQKVCSHGKTVGFLYGSVHIRQFSKSSVKAATSSSGYLAAMLIFVFHESRLR